MFQYLGLWILTFMTLNMWAILSVLASAAKARSKAGWTLLLLALPGLGFLGWYLLGPRRATA